MTEKNYNAQQRESKTMKKQENIQKAEPKANAVEIKKEEKVEDKKETKTEDKKVEAKKQVQKIKKDEAVVNGVGLPISTLDSVFISKFIKGKTIDKAIADLEEVLKFRRAIPMTGEIPHRKGKGMMSGRYPIKPITYFIKMLKSLKANAIVNGIEEPIIVESISNKAYQPYGRFGSVRKKRSHVKIRVVEKNKLIKGKKK